MKVLALGVALGLSAGVSPGPLLALVVSGTLRGGLGVGLRVAAVPVLTDLPVIVLSVTALSALPDRAVAAGGLAGGLFLLWLGGSTLREARTAELPRPDDAGAPAEGRRTVRQGVLVNLLSPHPWLFWLTTGSPLLVDAWRDGPGGAGGFLAGFYALLVGSKALLALVVARTRRRMTTRAFRLLLAGAGGLLLAASALLLAEFGGALTA
ncbi:LysE family transporter [Streptomyces sp. I05A-00742]|uniref:LysE family transporter n=1 Tax=Streptomyces sp. I05A-00742 TaxID=2732853 RepID=UPI001488CBD2|nr:LysE family transporter [Streptomyces sp. I05A-00742]